MKKSVGSVSRMVMVAGTFAFVFLLLLLNAGLHIWSQRTREAVLGKRERALKRTHLLREIRFAVENQVANATLLGDLLFGGEDQSVDVSKAVEAIQRHKRLITVSLSDLMKLVEGDAVDPYADLREHVLRLGSAWNEYYRMMKEEPSEAVGIFIMDAQPEADALLEEVLPGLLKGERGRRDRVERQIELVARKTRWATVGGLLLTTFLLIGLAANAVRAERRLAAETRDRIRAETEAARKELETAAQIQNIMLPASVDIPEYECAMMMRPASEVGGDFVDVCRDGHGRFWVSIGDVTGHGLTSGLVMMITQTIFETVITQSRNGAGPPDVYRSLNQLLYGYIHERLKLEHHVTAMILRSEGEGVFTYTGAHEELFVYRKATGRMERIPAPGGWLGVFPDISHCTATKRLELARGDLLLLYTDGITEAQSAAGELFGQDRMIRHVEEQSEKPVASVVASLIQSVERFAPVQHDDMTCLLLRRKEPA